MANKRAAAKKQPEILDEEEELRLEEAESIKVCEAIATAIRVTKKLFGEANYSQELVMRVLKCLAIDGRDDDERSADLLTVHIMASEAFAPDEPKIDTVFDIFEVRYLARQEEYED